MNKVFKDYVESLDPSFQKLISMPPVTVDQLPTDMPLSGVYLFSEGENSLYAGRSGSIRKRVQGHCRPSSPERVPAFAYRLAAKITDIKPIRYSPDKSRKVVAKLPTFEPVFKEQKNRIRRMDLRFVSEPAPMRQALLEMYVAVALDTEYNDFDNH